MHTIVFQDEAWAAPDPAQKIATIVSEGTAGSGAEAEVLRQRVRGARWIDEIRVAPIARRRTLVYSRTPDRKIFMINGHVMDENRVNQTVKLGDTEEWTVVNTDQQGRVALLQEASRGRHLGDAYPGSGQRLHGLGCVLALDHRDNELQSSWPTLRITC